jgi:hypothetical protein
MSFCLPHSQYFSLERSIFKRFRSRAMVSSNSSPIRVIRKQRRRDYNVLHNGRDSHFSPQPDEASASHPSPSKPVPSAEHIQFDEPKLSDDSRLFNEILPSDENCITYDLLPFASALQLRSSPQHDSDISSLVEASDIYGPPQKKRKPKSRTSWTAKHFNVKVLDITWSWDGGPRLSSKDSARKDSTTNLATHLFTEHRIKQD